MEHKKLHIVALDVPFPTNYGGAIDIFYRIKALHQLGFQITLHCFEYGRGEQVELEKWTSEVIYYQRKKRIQDLFGKRPFIVKSRISQKLLNHLLQDNAPILFEGLHTCWYLENEAIQKRLTIVRAHNIEHEYYFGLMENSSLLKQIYFRLEHNKLKRYEEIISKASYVLPIREGDLGHFKQFNENVIVLPASLPEMYVGPQTPEAYCLFHGNLSVPENVDAVDFLLDKIWSQNLDVPLIIAGKNPSNQLCAKAKQANVEIIANPTDEEMQSLIQKAKVHVFYTSQCTGLKLKLLAALQSYGAVLVNSKMIEGTELLEYVNIEDDHRQFAKTLLALFNAPVDYKKVEARIAEIHSKFDTKENCKSVFNLIIPEGTRD